MTKVIHARELPVSDVFRNENQPRKEFYQDTLEELAMSIREYGVLEPIVVTPRDGKYMIIAGERRYRASQLAGLTTIPSIIKDADNHIVEELALLENIQRQDLNIIEEALAFRALLDRGLSKEELAQKMGFKQVWRIDERLSLLNLKEEYQELVINQKISNSQAFEMSRAPKHKQGIVLQKILTGELNSYNKLRSFVSGLLLIEQQPNLLELTTITEEEKKEINALESLLRNTEKCVSTYMEKDRVKNLEKMAFHATINPDRIAFIIKGLMKIHKAITQSAGVKDALEATS